MPEMTWIKEQRARLDAKLMLDRVRATGPKADLGPAVPAEGHINCRCVQKRGD